MPLFYKPADGWTGDYIPFYHDGAYHLFYLKDYRDRDMHGEGTPWFHISTTDFVNFADHGEALPRGTLAEQDLYVFTGSAIEKDGLFHIFYTGYNLHFRADGRNEQGVMHATSPDLISWTKDPANPILFSDTGRYELHDWRDPFVFWNEEAGEYWMLLAARLLDGPSNRRGCIALAASPDLVSWEVRDPFWQPSLYFTHECPDLFRLGDWWYLVYSTFSERHITHYRMSKSLAGPWTAPANDAFDTRAFYAAKTAGDGQRHFAFGWDPTRLGERDNGEWQWGGALVVHEIEQHSDGALTVKAPQEVLDHVSAPVEVNVEPKMGQWEVGDGSASASVPDSFAWARLAYMPQLCAIDATLIFEENTRAVGLILRADEALDRYYQVRLEPGSNRVVFDRWPRPGDQPFVLERPVELKAGQPVRIQVLVQQSIIVIYVNEQVALSTRGYDSRVGAAGIFVSEGAAEFSAISIKTLPG